MTATTNHTLRQMIYLRCQIAQTSLPERRRSDHCGFQVRNLDPQPAARDMNDGLVHRHGLIEKQGAVANQPLPPDQADLDMAEFVGHLCLKRDKTVLDKKDVVDAITRSSQNLFSD